MNVKNIENMIKEKLLIIIIPIRKIKYFGKKYKCNICNSWVREMRPFGIKHEIFEKNTILEAGYRENCVCPVCKSKDRIRLVFYYIKKYTDILYGRNTILHFAPEPQLKRKIKKNHKAKYYDGDISEGAASMVIDMTNIQFEDNKFDYIICNQVLEHIEEEEKAILELKRVIKPSGKIILTVPICISNEKTIEDKSITDPEQRLAMFCQEDHVRLYGRDFKERIENYGLKVEEYNFEESEGIEERKKYGIVEHGVIYIATK